MNINTAPSLPSEPLWQQGESLELAIADLSLTGEGVGRWGDRVVFVPDTVPGDRVQVRLLNVKPRFAHAQVLALLQPSEQRVRPACIVADKCGGCQWQPVASELQLASKQAHVIEALERIGKFSDPPVEPILAAPDALGYRNKATYPLNQSGGTVQAGYYRKGSHRLINLNQCPVQDARLDPLLSQIKRDIQRQGWSIYDEKTHRGQLRHLGLRIGRRTGQILLTLVTQTWELPEIEQQAQEWLQRYDNLVGVCLNRNGDRTNRIFGPESRCLGGLPYLQEEFAGLHLQIGSDTFFQVNTEQAEALVELILAELNLQGHEQVVDAYCGIGTLTLPIARLAQQVVGLELHPATVAQAQANAILNQITNVSFQVGDVAKLLPSLYADIVVLDPPRKGCDQGVIDALFKIRPAQIVYMSCNPATLARDLRLLCQTGGYRLQRVKPADFFPQTAHVECVAFLTR
ncbi:MAG: 23S rRNA (uracil(1939)-C(5))-methyltransferase RlmD [Aphanocapsa sp. GSE-SYN-MK-11-07L]|nr:23S rRNA (uracil(1939)-C(5))-methyltransferase RlmD [Aphanocapsa sp. GSE-SYN-MK-11-07L]